MIAAEPLPGSPTWRRQPVRLRLWQARTGQRRAAREGNRRAGLHEQVFAVPPSEEADLRTARLRLGECTLDVSSSRSGKPGASAIHAGASQTSGQDSHSESGRDDGERSLPSCAPGWRIRRVTASYLGDDAAGHVSLARLAIRSRGMMEPGRLIAYSAARREDDRPRGRGFPEPLMAAVPHGIHAALTGNGIQFADLTKNGEGLDRQMAWPSLRSRLSTPRHRASPDQAQLPMDRRTGGADEPPPTEAIVRRYHDDTHR